MIQDTLPLALAPMVGLSNVALRRLIKDYLPNGYDTFWPTEMLNSRRLPYQNLGQTPETYQHKNDTNLVPQLLANEEDFIFKSVKKLKDWGAVGIDINMGCPVKKALRHNYGVSLMGDIKYAAQIVRWTKLASDLPVSVKVRAGVKNDKLFLKDFLQALEAAGASLITIHPRLANEKRRGKADWNLIKQVKQYLTIPVIGNGDIQTTNDIEQMFEIAQCDAVMIGRALNAKPWLLLEWLTKHNTSLKNQYLAYDFSCPRWQAQEYSQAMLKLLGYLLEFYPENLARRKFQFHIKTNHMWLSYGQKLVGISQKKQSICDLKREWLGFFQQDIKMYQKTNLRY